MDTSMRVTAISSKRQAEERLEREMSNPTAGESSSKGSMTLEARDELRVAGQGMSFSPSLEAHQQPSKALEAARHTHGTHGMDQENVVMPPDASGQLSTRGASDDFQGGALMSLPTAHGSLWAPKGKASSALLQSTQQPGYVHGLQTYVGGLQMSMSSTRTGLHEAEPFSASPSAFMDEDVARILQEELDKRSQKRKERSASPTAVMGTSASKDKGSKALSSKARGKQRRIDSYAFAALPLAASAPSSSSQTPCPETATAPAPKDDFVRNSGCQAVSSSLGTGTGTGTVHAHSSLSLGPWTANAMNSGIGLAPPERPVDSLFPLPKHVHDAKSTRDTAQRISYDVGAIQHAGRYDDGGKDSQEGEAAFADSAMHVNSTGNNDEEDEEDAIDRERQEERERELRQGRDATARSEDVELERLLRVAKREADLDLYKAFRRSTSLQAQQVQHAGSDARSRQSTRQHSADSVSSDQRGSASSGSTAREGSAPGALQAPSPPPLLTAAARRLQVRIENGLPAVSPGWHVPESGLQSSYVGGAGVGAGVSVNGSVSHTPRTSTIQSNAADTFYPSSSSVATNNSTASDARERAPQLLHQHALPLREEEGYVPLCSFPGGRIPEALKPRLRESLGLRPLDDILKEIQSRTAGSRHLRKRRRLDATVLIGAGSPTRLPPYRERLEYTVRASPATKPSQSISLPHRPRARLCRRLGTPWHAHRPRRSSMKWKMRWWGRNWGRRTPWRRRWWWCSMRQSRCPSLPC
ncbi:hypothetical protein K437DRAFT_117988 [Tilletiaria anomala UBC 951]|uniref:Uncharacterized protein n=1 Tax=Tilletiaria anomala (strain ATCC 24038 / CBS 436.72 / UBC 951) TaxID=1037660 RepID=A0A066WQ85_TILAU|nr:uncharacterized protein K437DRAFT_117988 [Tilletiaria anomala UBC 951]KDN53169.1 hypothetical protein K437DRAFT_117988 [Tilletiaria anomala UBC 951]